MRTLERTEQYAQEEVICQRVAGVLSCSNSLNAFSFVMHRNDNRKCIPLSQKSHCVCAVVPLRTAVGGKQASTC